MLPSIHRRSVVLGSLAGAGLPAWQARAQSAKVLNVATTGDPGPLDPTPVTSDLLSEITQLFYETLYIFGPDFGIAPLLAAELPEITDGGKRYVIKLRSGVPFHDGTIMNAEDVVASLQRWGRLSRAGARRGRSWIRSRRRNGCRRDRAEAALFAAGESAGVSERFAADHAEARRDRARSVEGFHRHRAVQADRVQARHLGARGKIRQVRVAAGRRERIRGQARGAGGRDSFPARRQPDHARRWLAGRRISLGRQSDAGRVREDTRPSGCGAAAC